MAECRYAAEGHVFPRVDDAETTCERKKVGQSGRMLCRTCTVDTSLPVSRTTAMPRQHFHESSDISMCISCVLLYSTDCSGP